MTRRAKVPRWGWFEAPTEPGPPRLRIDTGWSPRRLSVEVIRSSLPWVLSGAALVVIFNVAMMLLPAAVGAFVDGTVAPLTLGAEFSAVRAQLIGSTGVIAGLYVVVNLAWRFGGRLGWYGVQRSEYELSQVVLERLLHPAGSAGRERSAGAALAVSTGDVHRTCLVLYAVVYPPGEIAGLVVATVVLFTVHPALGTGVVVTLPLILGVMHFAARPLRRRSLTEQAHLADTAGVAADIVRGYRVLRGIHAQDPVAARYTDVSRSALRATIAARTAASAFDGVSAGVAQMFAAAIAIAAVLFAYSGAISVGELVAVAGIAVTLIEPLDSLIATLGAIWAKSQASAARVLEVLASPSDPLLSGTASLGDGPGTLNFEHVVTAGGVQISGSVSEGSIAVLALTQEQALAIVELLSLRKVPETGRILLDGQDILRSDPEALRSRMLVLPHVPGLFSGSVRENAHPGGATSDDAIEAALRVAGMMPHELPGGYETEVGRSGAKLSGGQRQRIALARAIAADPDVLVLVEPTSSVDAVTELGIVRSLRQHRAGRTTLVLTTSPVFAVAHGDAPGLRGLWVGHV